MRHRPIVTVTTALALCAATAPAASATLYQDAVVRQSYYGSLTGTTAFRSIPVDPIRSSIVAIPVDPVRSLTVAIPVEPIRP